MTTSKTAFARNKTKPANRSTAPAPLREAGVWQPFRKGWRQLYGGIYDTGVSVEWHDFESGGKFEWSRSFHPGSLELCLNLEGGGSIQSGGRRLEFTPLTAGFYLPGKNALRAWRPGKQRHRFLTVEFSREYLRGHLARCDGAIHPLVEAFIRDENHPGSVSEMHRLTAAQEQLVARMQQPPTVQAARTLWQQSQVLQLMVEFFFERRDADELFCDRQKRLARERVDKAIGFLREEISEPPSLEELGRKVGCSPFHLSRTFSREMGMTLPQYLRKLRMERAAELLRGGKHNVTEAAMEVGYSSLSHFSQAFCQTMGCCPALYPLKQD
jgi:AraC family transcriptional regulator